MPDKIEELFELERVKLITFDELFNKLEELGYFDNPVYYDYNRQEWVKLCKD